MSFFAGTGRELKVPAQLRGDPEAYECLRVWMRRGAPEVFLEQLKETNDPRAWGSVLADIAAFASGGYRGADGRPDPEALAQLQKMFNYLVDQWVEQRRAKADR
jgi:hypothetical protein